MTVCAILLISFTSTLVGDRLAIGRGPRLTTSILFLGSALLPALALSVFWVVFGSRLEFSVGSSYPSMVSGIIGVSFFGGFGALVASFLTGWRTVTLLVVLTLWAAGYAALHDSLTHDTLSITSSVAMFAIGSGYFVGYLRGRRPAAYGVGAGRAGPYMALLGAFVPMLVLLVLFLRRLGQQGGSDLSVIFGRTGGINDVFILFVASVSVMFMVTLPIANGLLDWISWFISRKLCEHLSVSIRSVRSIWALFWRILVHMAIDFIAAVVFLVVLAFALGHGFGYLEDMFSRLDYDFAGLVEKAVDDPWAAGAGLWFSVMLVSTLLPTAFHFLLLLASPVTMVAVRKRRRLEIATRLREWSSLTEHERRSVAVAAVEARYQHLTPVFGAATILLFLTAYVLWLFVARFMPEVVEIVGRAALLGARVASLFW